MFKNKLLCIAALLVVSISSFFLFAAEKWQFFYGESCVIELLLLFFATVVICPLTYYNWTLKKSHFYIFLGLALANTLIVIPPLVNHTNPNLNIHIFQLLHLVLLLSTFITQKKIVHDTVLSGYMIYCSAIAYRLNTVGYFFHDGEGLGVGNLEMLISIFVLFCVSSLVICFKHYKE